MSEEKTMYEVITLTNPLDVDFKFQWNGEEYNVPARSTKPFPAFLAVHGAKNLADAIMSSRGQFNDKIMPDGKRKYEAVSKNDRAALAKSLIGQEKEMNVPEPEVETTPVATVEKEVEQIVDIPAGQPVESKSDPVSGPIKTAEETMKNENRMRFEELALVGWAKLGKTERAEYRLLKKELNL